MNQNPQYGVYPQPEPQIPVQPGIEPPMTEGTPVYPQTAAPQPVVQPMPPVYPAAGRIPPWADPQKLEQKELRKASSRLSWAIFASLPLSAVLSIIAGVFLMLSGVNLFLPEGEGVGGMPGVAYYLLSSVVSFVTIALPFALFLIIGKRRLADSILVEKTGFLTGLLLVFAGLFVCMIMNYPANWISLLLESLGLNGSVNTDAMTVNSLMDIHTLVLCVVLVAPITEEFAFRGVTVAVLRRWGDWPAVVFSAIIFALAHFSFQALPVVLMGGFVMALLYVWTKNIWINIFIHFLNNLVATLPIIVEFYWGEEASIIAGNAAMLAVCGLGLIALILLLVLHFTGRRPLPVRMQRGTPVRKKALQMYVNVGFIVYFISFLVMAVVSLYAV